MTKSTEILRQVSVCYDITQLTTRTREHKADRDYQSRETSVQISVSQGGLLERTVWPTDLLGVIVSVFHIEYSAIEFYANLK
jgi:hypothetical protein